MHVVVTEDDIEKGKPGISTLCPIALAIKRQIATETGKFPKVFGRHSEIRTTSAGGWDVITESAVNPEEVAAFIDNFDNNKNMNEVKPFEFDLEFVEYGLE